MLEAIQNLPMSSRVKSKVHLFDDCWLVSTGCVLSPLWSFLPPTSFPLTHSAPASPVPLLILKHARHAPTSGPLHLLFPLPAIVFPQLHTWLTHSLPSGFCSKVIFSVCFFPPINLLKAATVPLLVLITMCHTIYLCVYFFLVCLPPQEGKVQEGGDFVCVVLYHLPRTPTVPVIL